jgi:hypothetical protein
MAGAVEVGAGGIEIRSRYPSPTRRYERSRATSSQRIR